VAQLVALSGRSFVERLTVETQRVEQQTHNLPPLTVLVQCSVLSSTVKSSFSRRFANLDLLPTVN
jgi:hypothetical protein